MKNFVFKVLFSVETDDRFDVSHYVVVVSGDARSAISIAEKKLKQLYKKEYIDKLVRALPVGVEKLAELTPG